MQDVCLLEQRCQLTSSHCTLVIYPLEEVGASGRNRSKEHSRRRTNTAFGMDDEFAGIANEIRFQSGIVRTKHTFPLRKINNCFTGISLVNYLARRKANNQEESIQVIT